MSWVKFCSIDELSQLPTTVMVAAGKSAVDALKHRDDKVIVWYGFGDSPIGMVSKSTGMTA